MMQKNKKIRIVYITPNNSTFTRGDQKIFEKFADISTISLSQLKGNIKYAFKSLKMFVYLISKVFTKNIVFIAWFADYHSAVMTLAAKLTGKKSIILIGGQEAVCYKELNKGVYRNKIRSAFVKYALRNTSLIIANHKSLIYHENYYYNQENPHIDGIKHYVKGLKTPVEIINNGVDTSKFIRDYSIQKNDNLILTVGTMNQTGDFYNKGFDLFIMAAKRNPNLQFILIGLHPNFIKWTEENFQFSKIVNLKIIPSYCPHEILNESYNKAKVFVQASITEGMPNTLSEAMLLECIPVGSKTNGIPDAIGDTGIVIEKRSVEELEKGILEALKMNTAKQARERVMELFSIEKRELEFRNIINLMTL